VALLLLLLLVAATPCPLWRSLGQVAAGLLVCRERSPVWLWCARSDLTGVVWCALARLIY
jgi:hypothetical protein